MNQQCMGRRLRPRTAVCPLSSCHFLSGRILERWNGRKVWPGWQPAAESRPWRSNLQVKKKRRRTRKMRKMRTRRRKRRTRTRKKKMTMTRKRRKKMKSQRSPQPKRLGASHFPWLNLGVILWTSSTRRRDVEYLSSSFFVHILCSYVFQFGIWIATFQCAPATYGAVPAPWVSHMRFSHVHDPSEGLHFSWRVAPERLKL